MSWALRRATATDAELLGNHRADVWRNGGRHPEATIAAQIPIWTAWFRDAVDDGTYVAWIAEDANGAAVGSAGLLLRVAMPRPGFPVDRDGRVQSVYVVPAMRRRGIARAMLAEIIAFAREALLIQLVLHPSNDGRALYAGLGFIPNDEMALRFDPP